MAGTFTLGVALHDGLAADCAREAQAGDTTEATVQGSTFELPEPASRRVWMWATPRPSRPSTRCSTPWMIPPSRYGATGFHPSILPNPVAGD
ncbi:hypothetical protein [Paeniglutamicibacter kerguelensis]|uniref:Uncharacterized protein n=1 Tax=Paeniglutamicibacter kerguelensis TaxID=254788 RepID=A0ABS4XGE8_9MICC|nr:hypothetical protein [Paeniglutamicibacter kerguelensis]MBP2387530.1 hypothetical protein [Paeniglutamicibacter kerguelensis]